MSSAQVRLGHARDPLASGSPLLSSTDAALSVLNFPLPTRLLKSPQIGDDDVLQQLFTENVAAKIWRVATRDLENNSPPTSYPEIVPQDGPLRGRYELRESSFWTCGFFPGSLYTLLERLSLYSSSSPSAHSASLLSLCRAWAAPLHFMANRTDTHDLGFIVAPLQLDYELTGDSASLASLLTAARSLASRYVSSAAAIRSWDLIRKKDVSIISQEENCIVIIDSACNLDLLFYAASKSGENVLHEIARTHAHTLLKSHLRPETLPSEASRTGFIGQLYSTCHVANIDPRTGAIMARMTAQGYAHESTWARGQSWAILGFAQTYQWTKEKIFLDAACGCAEYFLQRLWTGTEYSVPSWDFDAPIEDPQRPVFDSSASAIAANGFLVISEALEETKQPLLAKAFREAAMEVVRALLRGALAEEKAVFVSGETGLSVRDVENGKTFDSILKNGTANNNVGANRRYCNHGLVYGDYYLLQFGNRLLQMGLA